MFTYITHFDRKVGIYIATKFFQFASHKSHTQSHCGVFWHCVTVRHHCRAFGDHWVSHDLVGAMHVPLHVLAVLLCSAYRACSCSLLFKALHPHPPIIIIYFFIVLIIHSLTKVSTVLPVQCDGYWGNGWGRVFRAGRARGRVASRAGSWVFWLFGFGVSSSSPPCSWAPNLHM